MHVSQVMSNVPVDQRCTCDADGGSEAPGGAASERGGGRLRGLLRR